MPWWPCCQSAYAPASAAARGHLHAQLGRLWGGPQARPTLGPARGRELLSSRVQPQRSTAAGGAYGSQLWRVRSWLLRGIQPRPLLGCAPEALLSHCMLQADDCHSRHTLQCTRHRCHTALPGNASTQANGLIVRLLRPTHKLIAFALPNGPTLIAACRFCTTEETWHAPVATASASLSFQCRATFSARGSSGLGALSSAWMLRARSSWLWVAELRSAHRSGASVPCCHFETGTKLPTLGSEQHAQRHARSSAPRCSVAKRAALAGLDPHLIKTVRICRAGLHLSFRMSRQMRPSLSMLGWYIFVRKRTCAPTGSCSGGCVRKPSTRPPLGAHKLAVSSGALRHQTCAWEWPCSSTRWRAVHSLQQLLTRGAATYRMFTLSTAGSARALGAAMG